MGDLDEVDRKILGTISENPEISQIELSELLNIENATQRKYRIISLKKSIRGGNKVCLNHQT